MCGIFLADVSALVLVDEFKGDRRKHGEGQHEHGQPEPVAHDVLLGAFVVGIVAGLGDSLLQDVLDPVLADHVHDAAYGGGVGVALAMEGLHRLAVDDQLEHVAHEDVLAHLHVSVLLQQTLRVDHVQHVAHGGGGDDLLAFEERHDFFVRHQLLDDRSQVQLYELQVDGVVQRV